MVARHPKAHRRRGATLVEAAFVLPLPLLFLLSILEFARYLMVLHVANNAAREGARYAIVHAGDGTTKSQILDVVNSRMAGINANIDGYAVDVFTVDPAGLYDTTTNKYKYPPTIKQLNGSQWNDAQFSGALAVQITGTYTPIISAVPFMDRFNVPIMSPTPLTVTAMMSSEAN
jgi:Flp pilus assembly protein TadG